ncbi:MAG TPA: hypothetical protein VGE51_10490 [Fontimonas sp.]
MSTAARCVAVALGLLSLGALAAESAGGDSGTTIVGEREAAVGLYLTPWREERASDVDRAPRLYEASGDSVNAADLQRQVDVRESMEAYWRLRLLRR